MAEDPRRRLGRGVIVSAGGPAPEGWTGVERVTIDDAGLREPEKLVEKLHGSWTRREPFVVDLAVDVGELRAPETDPRPPYLLDPSFEFAREHLYFLARANNYDARRESLAWGPGLEAARLGATVGGGADVVLPDGTEAWIDGGPRTPAPLEDAVVVHRVRVEHGDLTPDREATITADLAPDQLAAVAHSGGPARIIAPAGSGKTRVLTERFRALVAGRDWGAAPVCAVAYNVRAKAEMEQRLSDLGAPALRKVRTLHALGFDALRRSRGDHAVLSEWDVRRRVEALVPVRPRPNTDVYAPYLEALGEVRLGLVTPQVVEGRRDDVEGFAAMFDAFRAGMRADRVLDHDEQIYGALEVLLADVDVRRAFQRECRHLLVDEFQDLTPAQLLMLRLVAAPAYDVFGVGDDDQVIYGYAGADPRFLVDYDSYFPGAAHTQLEVNYRCPPEVVHAAANLLTRNRVRVPKEIRAAKDPGGGQALTVAKIAAEELPAAAFARVEQLLADGAAPEQVAVLARVRASLLAVQLACREAGIPANTPIGPSVLERTGMRTALAYVRLAVAHDTGMLAGVDVATAARRPSRSLRREVLERVGRRRQWRVAELRRLANESSGRFDEFLDDVETLAAEARAGATTEQLLRVVRDTVGLGTALDTLDRGGRGPEASHRDDLNALISVARHASDPIEFEPWLRAALAEQVDEATVGQVTLSTVHRVKGMEWPHVVVLGAHDGLMPHHLADDVDEERRVFHVALTRTSATAHLVADEAARTRFVDELARPADPAELEREATLVAARQARPPAPARAPDSVSAADQGLFDALQAWRRERARADGVPAYVVLHDSHLRAIAAERPKSLVRLARCPGIGPTKLERYGDEIVAIVNDLSG